MGLMCPCELACYLWPVTAGRAVSARTSTALGGCVAVAVSGTAVVGSCCEPAIMMVIRPGSFSVVRAAVGALWTGGCCSCVFFPDDQDVHAAAIHAVTMRTDPRGPTRRRQHPNHPSMAGVSRTLPRQRAPQSTHRSRGQPARRDRTHPAPASAGIPGSAAVSPRRRAPRRSAPVRGAQAVRVDLPLPTTRPPPHGVSRTQDQAVGLDMARTALTDGCLVDASALHTLALLPDLAPTLLTLAAETSANRPRNSP